MRTIPKCIEGNKALIEPFDRKGEPTLVTSILATLIPNKPLSKERILGSIDEKHTGKSRGYLSNHFSALSKSGILQFIKRDGTWTQGINFNEYMGYVFMELIQRDGNAAESFQYRLLPKHDSQAVDFIKKPTEDIFNQPNPYLDD